MLAHMPQLFTSPYFFHTSSMHPLLITAFPFFPHLIWSCQLQFVRLMQRTFYKCCFKEFIKYQICDFLNRNWSHSLIYLIRTGITQCLKWLQREELIAKLWCLEFLHSLYTESGNDIGLLYSLKKMHKGVLEELRKSLPFCCKLETQIGR